MYVVYSQDYLAHYGIKGQKWGVRRWQNEDGTFNEAGKKRYFNVIDRIKSDNQAFGKAIRGQIKGASRNLKKGNVLGAGSYLFGHKGAQVTAEAYRDHNQRLADHARTKLGKAYRSQAAKNLNEVAKYHNKVAKDSAVDRFIRVTFFDSDAFNMPYHRLSGRTTTLGKNYIENTLTLGIAGAVKDAKYLHDKKKSGN